MTLEFMRKPACSTSRKHTCSIGTELPNTFPWMSLLRFHDHGLVRIICDVIVKRCLRAGFTLLNNIFIIILIAVRKAKTQFRSCRSHTCTSSPLNIYEEMGSTGFFVLVCGKRKFVVFLGCNGSICSLFAAVSIFQRTKSPRKKRVMGVCWT